MPTEVEESLKNIEEQEAIAQQMTSAPIPVRRMGFPIKQVIAQQQQAIEQRRAGGEYLIQAEQYKKDITQYEKDLASYNAQVQAQARQQEAYNILTEKINENLKQAPYFVMGSRLKQSMDAFERAGLNPEEARKIFLSAVTSNVAYTFGKSQNEMYYSLGLKPIIVAGKITGFEDTKLGKSYSLPELPTNRPEVIPILLKANVIQVTPMEKISPEKLPSQISQSQIEYNEKVKQLYEKQLKNVEIQQAKSFKDIFGSEGTYQLLKGKKIITVSPFNLGKQKLIQHEIGHLIGEEDSELFKISSKNLIPDFLENIGYTKEQIGKEYFARSFSNYISSPEKFKLKYPEQAKVFEQKLGFDIKDISAPEEIKVEFVAPEKVGGIKAGQLIVSKAEPPIIRQAKYYGGKFVGLFTEGVPEALEAKKKILTSFDVEVSKYIEPYTLKSKLLFIDLPSEFIKEEIGNEYLSEVLTYIPRTAIEKPVTTAVSIAEFYYGGKALGFGVRTLRGGSKIAGGLLFGKQGARTFGELFTAGEIGVGAYSVGNEVSTTTKNFIAETTPRGKVSLIGGEILKLGVGGMGFVAGEKRAGELLFKSVIIKELPPKRKLWIEEKITKVKTPSEDFVNVAEFDLVGRTPERKAWILTGEQFREFQIRTELKGAKPISFETVPKYVKEFDKNLELMKFAEELDQKIIIQKTQTVRGQLVPTITKGGKITEGLTIIQKSRSPTIFSFLSGEMKPSNINPKALEFETGIRKAQLKAIAEKKISYELDKELLKGDYFKEQIIDNPTKIKLNEFRKSLFKYEQDKFDKLTTGSKLYWMEQVRVGSIIPDIKQRGIITGFEKAAKLGETLDKGYTYLSRVGLLKKKYAGKHIKWEDFESPLSQYKKIKGKGLLSSYFKGSEFIEEGNAFDEQVFKYIKTKKKLKYIQKGARKESKANLLSSIEEVKLPEDLINEGYFLGKGYTAVKQIKGTTQPRASGKIEVIKERILAREMELTEKQLDFFRKKFEVTKEVPSPEQKSLQISKFNEEFIGKPLVRKKPLTPFDITFKKEMPKEFKIYEQPKQQLIQNKKLDNEFKETLKSIQSIKASTLEKMKPARSLSEKQIYRKAGIKGERFGLLKKTIGGVVSKDIFKELNREINREVSKELTRTIPREISREIVREVPREITRDISKEFTREITRTIPREITREIIREVPRIIPTIIPPPKPPREPPPIIPIPSWYGTKRQIKKALIPSAYNVFGKETGNKRIKLNPQPLTKQDALNVGAFLIDTSLGASFEVKPAKGKPSKPSINIPDDYFGLTRNKFREYKIRKKQKIGMVDAYIEKRARRLDTPQEVRRINLTRRIKQLKQNNLGMIP